MKKTIRVLLAVIVVFAIFSGRVNALELELNYNPAIDPEFNLLTSSVNTHTIYSLAGYGVAVAINKEDKKLLNRSVEIIADSLIAGAILFPAHEYAHVFTALENGAKEGKVTLSSPWTGSCDWEWDWGAWAYAKSAKAASAGINLQNKMAEEALGRSLGKINDISEYIWFIGNQGFPSVYYAKTKKPEAGDWGGYDSKSWAYYVANGNIDIAQSIFRDYGWGAVWQAMGVVMPLYAGAKYWITGAKYQIPNSWVNPQAELTDAGIMFALSAWHRFNNNVVVRIRPGYGENRVDSRRMFSLEAEISEIPLPMGFSAGIRGGYSETRETAKSIGASIEKDFGKWAIGYEGNYYSGYHRNNPRAEGKYSEGLLTLKYNF